MLLLGVLRSSWWSRNYFWFLLFTTAAVIHRTHTRMWSPVQCNHFSIFSIYEFPSSLIRSEVVAAVDFTGSHLCISPSRTHLYKWRCILSVYGVNQVNCQFDSLPRSGCFCFCKSYNCRKLLISSGDYVDYQYYSCRCTSM